LNAVAHNSFLPFDLIRIFRQHYPMTKRFFLYNSTEQTCKESNRAKCGAWANAAQGHISLVPGLILECVVCGPPRTGRFKFYIFIYRA